VTLRPADAFQEQTNPWVILVIRVAFSLMFSGLAVLLAYNGGKAIRDRHFDNRWTTTSSIVLNERDRISRSEKGEEQLDGAQALRFGIGLLAAAAMLAEWSVGLASTIVRGAKPSDERTWTRPHSIAAILSLGCLLTAVVLLLPPERIGRRLFTTVFYGTIGVISVVVFVRIQSRRRGIRLVFRTLLTNGTGHHGEATSISDHSWHGVGGPLFGFLRLAFALGTQAHQGGDRPLPGDHRKASDAAGGGQGDYLTLPPVG
jgi:hypothetical protein